MFPWNPLFLWGGEASDSDVLKASFFCLGGDIVFRCSRGGILFSFEGGGHIFIFLYPRGILFSIGGRSCSDVPSVSPFSLGGGGIVFRCSHGFPFYVGEGHRILMFLRHPFFHWGGKGLFRCCSGGIPSAFGGTASYPDVLVISPRYPFSH